MTVTPCDNPEALATALADAGGKLVSGDVAINFGFCWRLQGDTTRPILKNRD